MKTDHQIYTLLGADPDLLSILTDGITVTGPYQFEAIELKALARRTDGVLMPQDPDTPIWVIEFQAQADENIYYRLVVEMGLLGQRQQREVRGFILFAEPSLDPKTQPWHRIANAGTDPPLRTAYLSEILGRLAQRDPDHPLLAVFLPYRLSDRDTLREQASGAIGQIQNTGLAPRAQEACLTVFWSWLSIRFSDMNYREILRMIGNLPAFEQTQAYRDILAQGRQNGERDLLLRQMRRRFGSLPEGLVERIHGLQLPKLEALAEAFVDFRSIADAEAWLERPQAD